MKNFSDVNLWIKSTFFSDLTNTITRAVSRVTTTRNDIYRIEQEYVSAYNSIQTLGYDQQGHIEDQTSPDRLSIPAGVISKYNAILRQHQNALSVDRDQFTAELLSFSEFQLGHWVTKVLPSNTQAVYDFGGVVKVVVEDQDGITATAIVPRTVPQLFTINVTAGRTNAMPNIVYNESGLMSVLVWANCYTYPAPTSFGDTSLKWRVIMTKTPDNQLALVVDFKDALRNYCFRFRPTSPDSDGSCYFSRVAKIDRFVTSQSDLEDFIQLVHGTLPTSKGMPYYNSSSGNTNFMAKENFNADYLTAWNTILSGNMSALTDPVFCSNSPKASAEGIFNRITSITPELIDSLRSALNT